MITAITQFEPVTALQRSYQSIFDKLIKGPVVLSNRGKAAAVLLSVEEYERQMARLRYFERQEAADRAIVADQWVAGEEVDQTFAAMGISECGV